MPLYHTSGSTGSPKQFQMSAELLQQRAARLDIAKGEGFSALKSVMVMVGPRSTTAAVYECWMAMTGGKYLLSRGTYAAAAEQVRYFKPEGLIGYPAQLAGLAIELFGTYAFKTVLCSGEAPLLEHIAPISSLSNDIRLSYGTQETHTIALASFAQIVKMPRCVGVVRPDVDWCIVGDEIQVKTPVMIGGYVDPRETRRRFVDGWFRTGDRGHLTADNLLMLDGRIDAVLAA